MEKQEAYLIAVDLDDTALHDLRTLNPITAAALREASRQGHTVMIATARPFCLVEKHYRLLGLDTPVSLCNGADYQIPGASWFPGERVYLPVTQVRDILAQFADVKVRAIQIENNDDLYVDGDFNGGSGSYFQELYRMSHRLELRQDNLPTAGAGRLFVWTEDTADADERVEQLEQIPCVGVFSRPWRGSLYSSGKTDAKKDLLKEGKITEEKRLGDENLRMYSFWSLLANKWFGVEKTAAFYGIPPERILTFGDDKNDLGMLQNARFGFAMKNGNPAVLAQAGRVTRWTNREGGVGREVNELLGLGMQL